ncbi:hypothetical protein BDV59DRAFT_183401 [Aspergillus ambiguus]|uniref:uncharacterized protein n=1 Tax=Aspergillus ambiguus TaxID=176160 RepID=UPI003CCDBCEB
MCSGTLWRISVGFLCFPASVKQRPRRECRLSYCLHGTTCETSMGRSKGCQERSTLRRIYGASAIASCRYLQLLRFTSIL